MAYPRVQCSVAKNRLLIGVSQKGIPSMASALSRRLCTHFLRNFPGSSEYATPWKFRSCAFRTQSASSNETSHSRNRGTVDEEEVQKFTDMAKTWWNESGDAAPLHTMNRLRVPFIRDSLVQRKSPCNLPLQNLNILDVGCGGGVLAEPLARLGASVHGVDALEESVHTAQWHAQLDPQLAKRLTYSCRLVEDIADESESAYDAVICSEIIEHVADPSQFLAACSKLLKPGGSIFITTINKTPASYALAIAAGEYIFNIVPRGTHDWNKFVSPEELRLMLQGNGLETQLIHGMTLNPVTFRWQWIKDTSINYALHAVKQE